MHAPQDLQLALDVGGGPGLFSEVLARRGPDVICLDLSEAMIRAGLSQREIVDALLGGTSAPSSGRVFRVAGSTSTMAPHARGRFDAILAIAVLEYAHDPESLMRGLSELLRVGGRLFFTGPEPRSPIRRLERPLDRVAAALGRRFGVGRLRDREYSALRRHKISSPRDYLKGTGLKEVAQMPLPLGDSIPRRWFSPSVLVIAEKM